MIYLDNAATTYPKPQMVRNKMAQALLMLGANPGRSGYRMAIKTAEAIYNSRCAISDFFGADGAECVVFQPGCTQAINTVVKGLLKSGDHVVVSDLEHNAVMRPLEKLKASGVSVSVASVYPGDNDLTVNSFRSALQANTKLIICTHASNVFGIRLPVERIAALAHAYGIKICVDCAQTAGLLPINMGAMGIDYLCCAGHKGLYGPMGIGILLLRSGDRIDTLTEGGTGTHSHHLQQPADPPERYESGTQNIPGIVGLHAGIDFVQRKGIDAIYQHEMRLIRRLYRALENMDRIRLYTNLPEGSHYLPVLSFTVEKHTSEEVGDFLGKFGIAVRCGMHCAPSAHRKMGTENGTVRVTPSVFTLQNEIDTLVRQIKKLATMG